MNVDTKYINASTTVANQKTFYHLILSLKRPENWQQLGYTEWNDYLNKIQTFHNIRQPFKYQLSENNATLDSHLHI